MEKLIRDNIPDIPNEEYKSMKTRTVKDVQEHISFLIDKIDEERYEFSNTKDGSEKIKEAADLLEVYTTLIALGQAEYENNRTQFISECVAIDMDMDDLFRVQREKREKKWGFEKGIIWTYENL